jgi:hypothetical protein
VRLRDQLLLRQLVRGLLVKRVLLRLLRGQLLRLEMGLVNRRHLLIGLQWRLPLELLLLRHGLLLSGRHRVHLLRHGLHHLGLLLRNLPIHGRHALRSRVLLLHGHHVLLDGLHRLLLIH